MGLASRGRGATRLTTRGSLSLLLLCGLLLTEWDMQSSGISAVEADEYNADYTMCDQTVPVEETNVTCSNMTTVIEYGNGNIILAYHFGTKLCAGDYVLPILLEETTWSSSTRVIMYFFGLCYCFLGVAIISDIFMAAIEVITAKEVTVMKPNEKGEMEEQTTLYWNETVANLSLMALGSSAPEILLSVVETVGRLGKEAKDGLGPSTIVGSAAFNLLVITGICIIAIPDGENRDFLNLGVFKVTAFFSVFAYVWILVVLEYNGAGEVDIVEAFLTLFLFFALLLLSYGADSGWSCLGKKVAPEGHIAGQTHFTNSLAHMPPDVSKEKIAEMLRKQQQDQNDMENPEEFAEYAVAQMMDNAHYSRMRYRMNAIKALTGGKRIIRDRKKALAKGSIFKRIGQSTAHLLDKVDRKLSKAPSAKELKPKEKAVRFFFSTSRYDAFENERSCRVIVCRTPAKKSEIKDNPEQVFSVSYETSNGAAVAGEDYEYSAGVLTFAPDELEKVIDIPIIADNEYEPNENFFVTLKNPSENALLGSAHVTEVMIIDDDTPGEFGFADNVKVVKETARTMTLEVVRTNGSDGTINVRYETRDKSAQDGEDYFSVKDVLTFHHGETKKSLEIKLINGSYEKGLTFLVLLEIVNFPDCGAKYSENKQCAVTITSDDQFQATVDQVAALMQLNMEEMDIRTHSYAQQFKSALTVEGEDGEEPGTMDYVMHILTLFWKILFATVPPTSYAGGWLTFLVALAYIGLLTMVVGDMASIFGCALGVPNGITAITFVALGTSLPDTFASKSAAENDKHADASVGNVTGSNSVNVFLGLGLPWVIATLYHASNGTTYQVASGDLSFSVTVFCVVALICLSLLMFRRHMGWGVLGGPRTPKLASAAFCVMLWAIYIILSILKSTEII